MYKIYLFILVFSLLSCSNKEGRQINFPNNISFDLVEDEMLEFETTLETTDKYFSFFKKEKNRVPLYRSIKHFDYSMYVGLPYGVDLMSIKNKGLLALEGEVLSDVEECVKCVYRLVKNKDQFVVQYIVKVDSGLIMFLSITEKEALVRAGGPLSLEVLRKRILK